MTNTQKIINLLQQRPGLDDDEISRLAGISPRQQVNQICRRLEHLGIILRKTGSDGKIVNILSGSSFLPSIPKEKAPVYTARPVKQKKDPLPRGSLCLDHLEETLIIIPCSKKKMRSQGRYDTGPSIKDALPEDLRAEFCRGQAVLRESIGLNESTKVPAWMRYDGYFYQTARESLKKAIGMKLNIVILSGGYGAILATELIGDYEARLKLSQWPKNLLQSTIQAYAKAKQLKTMRAFVSQSSDYFKLLKNTDWEKAGIHDAALITPDARRGAMLKAPRAKGEAFKALLEGSLHADWSSSDGTRLQVVRLV